MKSYLFLLFCFLTIIVLPQSSKAEKFNCEWETYESQSTNLGRLGSTTGVIYCYGSKSGKGRSYNCNKYGRLVSQWKCNCNDGGFFSSSNKGYGFSIDSAAQDCLNKEK